MLGRNRFTVSEMMQRYWDASVSMHEADAFLHEIATHDENCIQRARFLMEVGKTNGREKTPFLRVLARTLLARHVWTMAVNTAQDRELYDTVKEVLLYFMNLEYINELPSRDIEKIAEKAVRINQSDFYEKIVGFSAHHQDRLLVISGGYKAKNHSPYPTVVPHLYNYILRPECKVDPGDLLWNGWQELPRRAREGSLNDRREKWLPVVKKLRPTLDAYNMDRQRLLEVCTEVSWKVDNEAILWCLKLLQEVDKNLKEYGA